MNRKLFIAAIALITALSSCTKLPIYQSQNVRDQKEPILEKVETKGFDQKNNISYGTAINDTNFYFKAVFHEEESLKSIMGGGIKLYFDPNGKTGKDYMLKVERGEPEMMQMGSSGQMGQRGQMSGMSQMGPMQRNQGGQDNQDFAKMIDKVLTKVTWDANGEEFVFYRSPQMYFIDVSFDTNEYNELVLEVQMPLKELPIPSDNILSCGLVSSKDSSSGSSQRPGGGMSGGMGGRMSGGRGGGMGGGMSGGRGGGMGGTRGGNSSSQSSSTIKLWFKVEF